MEMFEYAFMQRAFIVGVLLALIIPLIGVTVVLRRLSMLGDALSHTSLAGVLSGFTKNAANFNSFLFGSIVAISDAELYSVAAVSLLVLLASVLLYKELFSIALDERAARLSGVPVNVVSTIFTMLTAVTVAIAARTVGALIVSSMMVLPVACAMQLARSYRGTVWASIGFAELFTISGLVIAYYGGLKPGGTIVLMGVVCLIGILIVKSAVERRQAKKAGFSPSEAMSVLLSLPSAEGKRFRRYSGLPLEARDALPGRRIFAMTWRVHCRLRRPGMPGSPGRDKRGQDTKHGFLSPLDSPNLP